METIQLFLSLFLCLSLHSQFGVMSNFIILFVVHISLFVLLNFIELHWQEVLLSSDHFLVPLFSFRNHKFLMELFLLFLKKRDSFFISFGPLFKFLISFRRNVNLFFFDFSFYLKSLNQPLVSFRFSFLSANFHHVLLPSLFLFLFYQTLLIPHFLLHSLHLYAF